MEVGFYHCTRAAPVAVLPRLVQKAADAGFHVLVQSENEAVRQTIDEALWTFDDRSFLPHGLSGGANDEFQPVLISSEFEPVNGATIVMAMGGGLPPADASFERVLYLFDGNDDEALSCARKHWRALSARDGDGLVRIYWQQTSRGWHKQE